MLKSHFNLRPADIEEEEETKTEDEKSEGVHDEGNIFYVERILKKAEISIRLSVLGKTADGDGYTYLKATCTDMSLTNIKALKCFRHLQFINVSNNKLNLESLQVITDLPYLVLIHADKNLLTSAALNKMKYLQVIIMNNNNIKTVHDVFQPELSTLEVGYNKIRKVYFENRMPNIKCLDFRYNLIQDIQYWNFPNLDSLYLAGNKINSLIGVEKLVNLRILHLRNNPIKSLKGFDSALKKLQYINLRNCKVSTLKQIKKLRPLSALETLVIRGCPYAGGTGEEIEASPEEDDPEIRIEVLAALPRIKRLNKGIVTPEERTEAKALILQWVEDGEKNDEDILEEQDDEEHSNVE